MSSKLEAATAIKPSTFSAAGYCSVLSPPFPAAATTTRYGFTDTGKSCTSRHAATTGFFQKASNQFCLSQSRQTQINNVRAVCRRWITIGIDCESERFGQYPDVSHPRESKTLIGMILASGATREISPATCVPCPYGPVCWSPTSLGSLSLSTKSQPGNRCPASAGCSVSTPVSSTATLIGPLGPMPLLT